MHCFFCGNEKTNVKDSRDNAEGERIRRRYCPQCKNRFSTRERVSFQLPLVIKSDQRREPYSEHKLRTSLALALKKRPVSTGDIDKLVTQCETGMRRSAEKEKEVEAVWIGQFIMGKLRRVDWVAYLRYASVYLSFDDVDRFLFEIRQLREEQSPEEQEKQLDLLRKDPKPM